MTTSQKVAEVFEKRHDNVIRAIKDLHCSEDFRRSNFEELEIITENAIGLRQTHRHYEITKQGLVLLAMGFTGKKAAKFKVDLINEFNRMEAFIKEQQKSEALPMSDDELMARAVLLGQKKIEALKAKAEELTPKAETFDEITTGHPDTGDQ